TYYEGDAPPPHYHPNDEQWIYLLEGSLAVLMGEEVATASEGDIIYIPRNIVHGIKLLNKKCRFFTCKSPAGSGGLSEDYTQVENLELLVAKLENYAG
ncbi:MAG: cupin domain-containing protein, partial [Alphaproteobacteria bacterium]